ncbi:uncharacterized protein LOC135711267 [Ochlerotatus camptorhynchus]|uniref:uncharacterized protein LOC135711267 n=1 Tax=Ochlerotatus camptorhynchus TaxID=644619 RepID=UPI0031D54DBA
MANVILQNVENKRASTNTKYHCLYGYYFFGLTRARLAIVYRKSKTTISGWITSYEENGLLSSKQREHVFRKFSTRQRQWILDLYHQNPILYLEECRDLFYQRFQIKISGSSICRILHAEGLTWKALERKAIQIKEHEILRYCSELSSFDWDTYQLVFLDEVSLDNRSILRNRGYGIKGKRLVFRGEFVRHPRASFLCFLGLHGVLDCFETEGTLTRKIFFECCREFALKNNKVLQYPGKNSVWIMDGARIHCDANIILYLRSIGIIPVFLPPYCPFCNPVEMIFGMMKSRIRKVYVENRNENLSHLALETFMGLENYDCTKIYHHCGYSPGGVFNPSVGLSQNAGQPNYAKGE